MANVIAESKKKKRKQLDLTNVSKDPLVSSLLQAGKADDNTSIKTLTFDARHFDSFYIADFSDVHLGSPGADIDKFIRILNACKGLKNVAIIFNGDLLDNTTLGSVGNANENLLNPIEQQKVLIKIGADEEVIQKLVAVVSGNHENGARIKDSMMDPLKLVSTAWGVYELSVDYACRIQILLKNPLEANQSVNFTIMDRHGSGRGGSGPANSLDIALRGDKIYSFADYILVGHYHANVSGEIAKKGKSLKNTDIIKNIYIKSSNSYVENAPYAASAGLPASNTDPTILRVSVIRNRDLLDASKTDKHSYLPYEFKFDEICVDNPEFLEFVERERIKSHFDISKVEAIGEILDTFKQDVSKVFESVPASEGKAETGSSETEENIV